MTVNKASSTGRVHEPSPFLSSRTYKKWAQPAPASLEQEVSKVSSGERIVKESNMEYEWQGVAAKAKCKIHSLTHSVTTY